MSLLQASGLLLLLSKEYLSAREAHQSLTVYRQVLVAANAISAERGPTNTVLGGNFSLSSDERSRLLKLRRASDASLAKIMQVSPDLDANKLINTYVALLEARRLVDYQLSVPFEKEEHRRFEICN